MKKAWFYFILFAGTLNSSAQQPLTLDEAIHQMKQNNTQLKSWQYDINLSGNELSGTSSTFLPKVSATYGGLFSNDPLNAFGFLLQQHRVTPLHFDPGFLNHPGSQSNFNMKLSVQQPILNFDAISARRALMKKLDAARFQKKFAVDNLIVEIRNSYTTLQFLYEAAKGVEKGIEAYREILRNILNMADAGYAKKSDVLMVKVGLSEIQNKQMEIENNISNISDYLSWLMGIPPGNTYIPIKKLDQLTMINPDIQFSTTRDDIMAMKKGIESRDEAKEIHQKSLWPRLNLIGEFNLNDKRVLNFGANSYVAGFSLSWDIFKGGEIRNKIEQDKIEVDKSRNQLQLYMEQQKLILQKAIRELKANQDKINLFKTAEEEATESFRILKDRYNEGLEKTSDLLVAQAKVLGKRVEYLSAIRDYNLTVIQIEFLTQQNNN